MLLLAFGALIAAGIPVLLAITSVVTALGLYAPLSYLVPDCGTVANVVLLIGMAVGVDYSLFYLKREREERMRGRGPRSTRSRSPQRPRATPSWSPASPSWSSMAGLFLVREPVVHRRSRSARSSWSSSP